jgi:hypothetical protein
MTSTAASSSSPEGEATTGLLDLDINGDGGHRCGERIAGIVDTMHGRRRGVACRDTAR